jgi:hypothetical protein
VQNGVFSRPLHDDSSVSHLLSKRALDACS